MRIVQERLHQKQERQWLPLVATHAIVEYPDTINGNKVVLAEIQIRTLSMNFWATIEHSLNYKYKGEFPGGNQTSLEITANLGLSAR